MFPEPVVLVLHRRGPRPIKWFLSRLADAVCPQLDSLTTKTTVFTRQSIGEAIGIAEALDTSALLDEPDLPEELAVIAGIYAPETWDEILALASLTRAELNAALDRTPRLTHLRR